MQTSWVPALLLVTDFTGKSFFQLMNEIKIHGLDADSLQETRRLETGICDKSNARLLCHQDVSGQEHFTHSRT